MLAILNSSYNMLYKEILLNVSGADYWDKKVKIKENKEVWARIRCGCVGRAYKKGFKDWSCRLCNWGEETLTHLIRCPEAWKLQSDQTNEFMVNWMGNKREEELKDLLIETLSGTSVVEELCEFIKIVEKKIKGEM